MLTTMAYGERVFFTYVWGAPGEPASPLTFASKASRTQARNVLTEGDLVFTVCTRREPTPSDLWGRVVGLFCVSDLEVNTQDYELPRRLDRPEFDAITRFPFALHPLNVWEITSPDNMFSELVGPLTSTHHLQAQSNLVELDAATAAPLMALSRREVEPEWPKSEFGRGLVARKNSKLAPKHQGTFTGAFADHSIWFVYTLVLRNASGKALAVKVGYSNDPRARAEVHNVPLATEVTGLEWSVDLQQPASSEDMARTVEQAVLRKYDRHRLASNGEILNINDPMAVASSVAQEMRLLRE